MTEKQPNKNVDADKALVSKAISEYNRYRSPEAKAKLVSFGEKKLTVEFSGTFCFSCGLEAYFEDFIYELKGWVTTLGLR